MKTLNFKNQGKFLDENSSRYEATKGNVIIRIWKCAYSKEWRVEFCTLTGYGLEAESGDFNAYVSYKGMTKKELIEIIESKDLSYLDEPAQKLQKQMDDFKVWQKNYG